MLHRLKEKWNVSWPRFVLIFTTFALGGSSCGYLGRKVLGLLAIGSPVLYWISYIIIVTLLWPLCVLLISIPLGQFNFFRGYLKKMGSRMVGKERGRRQKAGELASNSQLSISEPVSSELSTINHQPSTNNIAIFASGAGSNAKRIIEHFRNYSSIKVSLIVCNNPQAGVLKIAADNNIPVMLLNRKGFYETNACLDELKLHKIDLVVLAGFLWMIPGYLIKSYPYRIINIHPALLPKYGGKGMYGENVHKTVIEAGEKESGITIHYVDEHYDNGDIIFQATCVVLPTDSPDTLADRIHELEHKHYASVIENVITTKKA